MDHLSVWLVFTRLSVERNLDDQLFILPCARSVGHEHAQDEPDYPFVILDLIPTERPI